MKTFPFDRVAPNALACLLLEKNKPFEIEELLPLKQVRSQQDWWDFHILAMAKLKQGLLKEAEEMFLRGARETPFAQSRAVFETSLTFVQLRLNQLDQIKPVPLTTAQIIQFPVRAVLNAHALAAQAKTDSAAELLESLDKHSRGRIVVLSDAIRRRYGVNRTMEPSPQLDHGIEELEFSLVLRSV